MVERVEKKLSELNCDFLSGFAFKSTDYSNQGIPLIKIGNIQNRIVAIDEKGNYIEESLINEKTEKYLLSNRDILIAMTGQGSVGRVGRLILNDGQKAILNQRVGKFICDEVNLNKEYLYYILTTDKFQDSLFHTGAGSGQPNLSPELILQTEIPYCEFDEQKSIASILSCLDDKIDLLHRQNATLEKMAETLFRQWFVPACRDEHGAGREEAKEEWETGKLVDEFDFTMGASPPGESYNEEGIGIPMYQGNADFGFRFPTNRVFTTDPKRFAEKLDTLISVRAPVGEQNMANERCCIGRGVAAFRFKKDNSFYTYTYYKMKSLMNDIKQFNETGTVFGSISKSDFENIDITLPDTESIKKFQNAVNPIDDKIITNQTQIRTLTTLRDTLLPKLMSGEVRVEM